MVRIISSTQRPAPTWFAKDEICLNVWRTPEILRSAQRIAKATDILDYSGALNAGAETPTASMAKRVIASVRRETGQVAGGGCAFLVTSTIHRCARPLQRLLRRSSVASQTPGTVICPTVPTRTAMSRSPPMSACCFAKRKATSRTMPSRLALNAIVVTTMENMG